MAQWMPTPPALARANQWFNQCWRSPYCTNGFKHRGSCSAESRGDDDLSGLAGACYMVAQTSFKPPPPPGVAPPVQRPAPLPTMLPAAAPSVAEAPPAEAPPVATHPNLVTMMTQLRQQLGLDETKMLGDLESAAEALGFVSDRNLTTGARIKALWHVACSFHVV